MRTTRHVGLVVLLSVLALGIATQPPHAAACTSAADCDDGNPCTDELCDDSLGCVYADVSRACDDGNACSSGDTCNAGTCVGGPIAAGCTSCQAIAVLPPEGGVFSGVTAGTGSVASSCGSTGPSPERVFRWTPSASGTAVIATCGSGTLYDSVVHVKAGTCTGTELGCNDDTQGCVTGEPSAYHGSRVVVSVSAGQTYVIVVDGYNGAAGAYTLTVTPPSLCGNGVREGLEACDGGDVAGCPSGQCTGTCTCVPPAGGLPDLVPQIVDVSLDFDTTVFAGDVVEGCAEATSGVDLLRFGAYSRNDGTADFTLGDPQCPTPCDQHPLEVCGDPDFICSPAAGHNHAHYNNYARYDLLDAAGQTIVVGHKQGYCLRDTTCSDPFYTCENQGVTAGCSDLYGANLGCQYLDITGIPSGTYTLRVTIDPFDRIPELSEGNNVAQQSVTIVRPGGATPTRTVTPARTATRTPTPAATASPAPTATPLPTQTSGTPAPTPTVNPNPDDCLPVATQIGTRTSYWRITPTYSCALGGACDTAYQIIKNPGTLAVCRVDAYVFNNTSATGSLAFSLVNAARTTIYGTSASVNVATLPRGTGLCVGGSTPGAACVSGTCTGGGTCDVDDDSNLTAFTFGTDVNVSGDFLLAARPQSLSNLVRWADTSPDTAYENSTYNAWNPFPSMANTGSDYVFRIYARVAGTPTASVVATPTPTPMLTGTTTDNATPAATTSPIGTTTPGATSTSEPTFTADATSTPAPTSTPDATTTAGATTTPAHTATATAVATTTPAASPTPVPTATAVAGACGAVISIPSAGGVFTGSTAGASSLAATCASTNTAPEQVYSWTPAQSGNAVIETCGAATSFDTVVSVRQTSCTSGQERGCNDDTQGCNTGEPSTYHGSRVRAQVTAGQTYFIVVDGYGGAQGNYTLRITPP